MLESLGGIINWCVGAFFCMCVIFFAGGFIIFKFKEWVK